MMSHKQMMHMDLHRKREAHKGKIHSRRKKNRKDDLHMKSIRKKAIHNQLHCKYTENVLVIN